MRNNTRNIKITLGETTYVYGIRSILYEMIYNLCDNAIIYSRDGGSITVKIENENNRTKLTVCDTGIGIPREHHNRIFERFYRVDKSHSKDTGAPVWAWQSLSMVPNSMERISLLKARKARNGHNYFSIGI